jgi:hypothetical protein
MGAPLDGVLPESENVMSKVFVCLFCALTSVSVAWAGAGIDLSVGACPGNPGAIGSDPQPIPARVVAVDTGSGFAVPCASGAVIALLGTWSPAEDVPDLVGLDGILDLFVADGLDTNPFWSFDPAGCNLNGLGSSQSRPPGCSTPVLYQNTFAPAGSGSGIAAMRQDPTRVRIAFTCFRPSGLAVAANQQLFGMQILVDGSAASEAGGECPGCCSEAWMTWGQADPRSMSGAPTTTLQWSTGNFNGFSSSMRFHGATADCTPVPTRSRTWGQLKSLYR